MNTVGPWTPTEPVLAGYVSSEVGTIPQDWHVRPLHELADVDCENLPETTDPDYSFHYISLEQVHRGRLTGYSEEVFRTAPSRARRVLRKDDVLMSTVRPNLKSHLLFRGQVKSAVCSTGFAVVRAKPSEADAGYLFAHLFGHAVVDCLLDSLDALIAKKRAIQEAVMQQLLTGAVRLPGHHREWASKRLSEVGTFSRGGYIRRDQLSPTGLPCVLYGEIYTRYSDYTAHFTSRIHPHIAEAALPVRTGDILFAASGETAEEIGRCTSYIGKGTAYAGGDIIVFTPSRQNSVYLGCLLNSPAIALQKARMAQGHAVVHIGARALAQISLALPELDEQEAVAPVIMDFDAEIEALEQRRNKTRAIKRGMMQQLLTGRTRLVESPASSGDATAS